jgi:hypothetical protein
MLQALRGLLLPPRNVREAVMGTRPMDHPPVSYADVERAMREVEKAHCCDITLRLTHPVNEGTPVLFWVTVRADPRIVGRKTIRQRHQVTHRWPSVDCRYIEALMLRLVYKLDHELDEIGHLPAEQATFVWDT